VGAGEKEERVVGVAAWDGVAVGEGRLVWLEVAFWLVAGYSQGCVCIVEIVCISMKRYHEQMFCGLERTANLRGF
jgi:hypothetical protein